MLRQLVSMKCKLPKSLGATLNRHGLPTSGLSDSHLLSALYYRADDEIPQI